MRHGCSVTKGMSSEKRVCPCCFQRVQGDALRNKAIAEEGKTNGARKTAEKYGLSRQRVRYLVKKLEHVS